MPPVVPEDFLDSAEEISEGRREIDYRNAVSRAYYAAYHACKTLAGPPPRRSNRSTGAHDWLVSELKEWPRSDETFLQFRQIGTLLEIAKDQRRDADYRLDQEFSAVQYEEAVKHVRNILQRLTKVAHAGSGSAGT